MCKRSLFILTIFCFFAQGCSSNDEDANIGMKNQIGEYIYRKHNEFLFPIPTPEKVPAKNYPWHKQLAGNYPKITKEFFRCKGSSLNPCHIVQQNDKNQHIYDCGGFQKHSLPLKDKNEFIYPILIELTNYIQFKTGKRLVITSGHRCPEHNTYVDSSRENQYSKHMIGAEVSFYVLGLEDQPEAIIDLIQNFYQENLRYQRCKEYQESNAMKKKIQTFQLLLGLIKKFSLNFSRKWRVVISIIAIRIPILAFKSAMTET
jgi:hypothetical protein